MRKTHWPNSYYANPSDLHERRLSRNRSETFHASPPERPYVFPWDVTQSELKARFLATKAL